MLRRPAAALFLGSMTALLGASALGADGELSPEATRSLKFVAGLRARGYHDIAQEYLDSLRKAPDTPADLLATLDYQEGRGLLDEATVSGDPQKQAALLDAARAKLDGFAKAQPKHPLATDALIQIAKLSIERGHLALNQSQDMEGVEAETKKASARAAFAEARAAYAQALPTLDAALKSFPKFIPNEQTALIEARERARESYQNALLQKTVVEYEDAQSWPLGSKERNALLDKAINDFEDVYKSYRTQLSGLTARMLQGKAHEEKGELGPAMGLYNDLFNQTLRDPQFDEIRRRVGYYRIIVDGSRKEHPLAVDEAARWLQEYPRERGRHDGLGVQLELAKNLLAMAPEMNEDEREEATRKATDRLSEVVRYFSPFKAEALDLLGKHKPKSALSAAQIAAMSFDEAMAAGDSAMSTREWDRAILLHKQAVRRADPEKDPAKANKARYYLVWCYYSSQRYYEAVALAEHLARRHPTRELSDKAAELGLNAHLMAYNTYNQFDRASDLDRLVAFADHVVATWPDTEVGDSARVYLGKIMLGRGGYLDAAKAFESVRADSPRRLEAQVEAGDARWRLAATLREAGKTAEADAEEKAALALVSTALDARKAAGTAPTDPAMIVNANALGEILVKTGKPKEALAILEPLAKALLGQTLSAEAAPRFEGLMTVLMQAHIADGQSSRAIEDMKALEKTGISRDKLTGLYLELSRSLKRDMENFQASKNLTAFGRTQKAYKEFLAALAGSEAGQSYESLMFAGSAMLELDMGKEAEDVFDRLLKAYEKDPAYKPDPAKGDPLLLAKVRRVQAMRLGKKFAEALEIINKLIAENRRMLDPMVEKGRILEDRARAERSKDRWGEAYVYWSGLATQLEKARPRRPEYFESVYHIALAQQGQGKTADAAKTLRGVMALSPSVGRPEIKAKYQRLLAQLTK